MTCLLLSGVVCNLVISVDVRKKILRLFLVFFLQIFRVKSNIIIGEISRNLKKIVGVVYNLVISVDVRP